MAADGGRWRPMAADGGRWHAASAAFVLVVDVVKESRRRYLAPSAPTKGCHCRATSAVGNQLAAVRSPP
jgi:hypothetical protein